MARYVSRFGFYYSPYSKTKIRHGLVHNLCLKNFKDMVMNYQRHLPNIYSSFSSPLLPEVVIK